MEEEAAPPAGSVRFTLAERQLKLFKSALQSLGKIGGELLVEALTARVSGACGSPASYWQLQLLALAARVCAPARCDAARLRLDLSLTPYGYPLAPTPFLTPFPPPPAGAAHHQRGTLSIHVGDL